MTGEKQAPATGRRNELLQIRNLLQQLGITANYTGYHHASYAVLLAAKEPESLLLVGKWLYPEVAKHYKTTVSSVERNIRTAADRAWKRQRGLLEEIAGHPLPQRPTASEFLAILSAGFFGQESE